MGKLRNLWKMITGRQTASLLKATKMYKDAVEECKKRSIETGKRFYLVWDNRNKRLVPLSYKRIKGRYDSYEFYRDKFMITPMTQERFKEKSFFYTTSNSGSKECAGEELAEKTKKFQRFYCMYMAVKKK